MSSGSNKNNGLGRVLFGFIISLICFGVFAYLLFVAKEMNPTDDTIVQIAEIACFAGIFFLILTFGFALPAYIAGKKSKGGTQATDPRDIFVEANMRLKLENYIPDGETMVAGIHAAVKESSVTCAYKDCVLTEDKLLPEANGKVVSVSKSKYSMYDLYISVTQHYFVVADCQQYRYLYEFDKKPVKSMDEIKPVTEEILLKDVGKCFRFEEIQSCDVKKGMAGSLNCVIKMKNESYFKLVLPKTGGIGGGMPNHEKYRDMIVACLTEKCNG